MITRTNPLNIRQANDLDSENIKKVVFSALNEYGIAPDPASIDADLGNIENRYNDNGGFFGIIETDGQIIATVGLYRLDNLSCEIRRMYVLPAQRGKGHGRKLLEYSLAKAKGLGFRKVVLETASCFTQAITLYKKYGFTQYSPECLSPRCNQAFELNI